jgi:putative ABC transport system ATP-binding protein
MIQLQGVRKTFVAPGGERFEALRGLDLVVREGEFLTVIGANGSGKSTLLNAVAGAVIPDEGSVLIDNVDVTKQLENVRARRIGRVFQDPFRGTAPSMSVAENLRLACLRPSRKTLRLGLARKELERYRDLLAHYGMGLEDRMNALVGTLSGGQRQALTLLMATIVRPSVLLLDEHTAALDPRAAAAVVNLTRQVVAEQSLPVLMVTHSMSQAVELGDATIVIHAGKVEARYDAEERAGLQPEDLRRKFDALYDTQPT